MPNALRLTNKLLLSAEKYLPNKRKALDIVKANPKRPKAAPINLTLKEHCEQSAACGILFRMLPHMVSQGKVVILCKYVAEVAILHDFLTKMNISCVAFHGAANASERDAAVQGLHNGSISVLVATIQVAGVGLNLTAARYLIIYSMDYEPGTLLEAYDRIVRLVQMVKPLIFILAPQSEPAWYQKKMNVVLKKKKVNDVVLDLMTTHIHRKLPNSIVLNWTVENERLTLKLDSTEFTGTMVCNWEGHQFVTAEHGVVSLAACAGASKVSSKQLLFMLNTNRYKCGWMMAAFISYTNCQ